MVPKAGGVKTTLMEQAPPAANVFGAKGQLFVCLKFALAAIEPTVRATFWLFFSVMVLAELVLPKVTLPEDRTVGERETA